MIYKSGSLLILSLLMLITVYLIPKITAKRQPTSPKSSAATNPKIDQQTQSKFFLAINGPVRVNNDLLAMTMPEDTDAQVATQVEPYLDADPFDANHLLAGWQEHRFKTVGARAHNYAVSTDRGKTWQEGILPGLTPVTNGTWDAVSDPWVAFGPDNRAYFASLGLKNTLTETAILVSASTDGGMHWGDPVQVVRSVGNTDDKEALTVDNFSNSPFFGTVYVSWNNSNGAIQTLLLSRSTDNGKTYSPPAKVRAGGLNMGVIPRIGPSGKVYLLWVGTDNNSSVASDIDEEGETSPKAEEEREERLLVTKLKNNAIGYYFASSEDGGLTWTTPKRIVVPKINGVNRVRSGRTLPSFAVDPVSENLYIAWVDSRWTGKDRITLIVSKDQGSSWTSPTNVSDSPNDAIDFTPSIAVNSMKQVAVSYYSLRNDPQRRFLTDVYAQISTNGGKKFKKGIRVTPQSFDLRNAAQAGSFFLGDYIGLAGNGDRFQLLWIDTHLKSPLLNQFQPDVFSASVP